MEEYISRQAAIDAIENTDCELSSDSWDELTDAIMSLPSEQPTADVVEVKHGRWIEYNYPGAECVYCSNCKEEYYPDDLLLGGNDYPNFCPNCGADMRKETDDAVG